MLNIFFISNDERLAKLIEHVQPFFSTRIRLATGFDQGLKELFENPPSLVFIQGQIGKISGETVARHLKSLLGTAAPKIILLGKPTMRSDHVNSFYDDSMPVYDSGEVFLAAFKDRIRKFFPDFRFEEILEPGDSAHAAGDAVSETADVEVPSVADACIRTADEQSTDVDAFPVQMVAESPNAAELNLDTLLVENEEQVSEKTDFSAQEITVASEVFDQNTFSPEDVFSMKEKPSNMRLRQLLCILLLLITLSSAAYGVMHYKGIITGRAATMFNTGSNSGVAKSRVMQPKPKIIFKGLPSFIQPEWRDLDYSFEHPGWERYVSSELDFRVFRENYAIKALQVIAVKDPALTETLLSSILEEFGCAGASKVANQALKDGFLVENVTVNGAAELVTYRNEVSKKLTAFVLEFT
jgi:CheY-like chemotaxis protein